MLCMSFLFCDCREREAGTVVHTGLNFPLAKVFMVFANLHNPSGASQQDKWGSRGTGGFSGLWLLIRSKFMLA